LHERASQLAVSQASPIAFTDGQRGIWQLVLLHAAGPKMELFVASDQRMLRSIGSVECRQSSAQLNVIGGPGIALAEAFVWSRCLGEDERQAVFVRGAITNGSTALRALGWHLLAGESPPEDPHLVELQTRIAGMSGVADLASAGITDIFLASVLEAVLANSSLHALILAENTITCQSGPGLLLFLQHWSKPAFTLDLRDCKGLGSDTSFEKKLLEVFDDGLCSMGVKVIADGTGLSEGAVQILANNTAEAQAAAKEREEAVAATEDMTRVFMENQTRLSAVWALEDDSTDSTPTMDVLERMQELNSAENSFQLLPPALVDIVPAARGHGREGGEEVVEYERGEKKKKGRPARREGESDEDYRRRLEEAQRKYEEYLQKRAEARALLNDASERTFSEKFQSEVPANMRGSGMLIAHFSYIGGATSLSDLKSYSYFGLCHRQERPRSKLCALDFHDAVSKGLLDIVSATGHSFGAKALHLTVKNPGKGQVSVVLSSGTIFEHIGWVHKQNLMVINNVTLSLWPKQQKEVKVDAHCMNLSCSCSAGESMYLTDFYFDNMRIAAHQSSVWKHFEGKFRACREKEGRPSSR